MSAIDDKDKVEAKDRRVRLGRRQELNDVAFVLSTPEGRRFYWRALKMCGIWQSSMTGNNTTFYNEGMRNIGLMLLADLEEADPEAYIKCLKESKVEEIKNG